MTLFQKWGLLLCAAFVAVLGITGAFIYCGERRELLEETLQKERLILEGVRKVARESLLTRDDLLLSSYVRRLAARSPWITRLAIRERGGRIMADTRSSRIGKVERVWPRPFGTAAKTLSLIVSNQRVAEIFVETDPRLRREAIRPALRRLQKRLGLALLLSGSFGAALAWGLATSISRPVRELELFAGAIARGELDQRWRGIRGDEIGRLGGALNRMAASLAELDRMKDEFVSAVSHELRSPLGAIAICLRVIREDRNAREEDLRLIERNIDRLTGFVNDLLDTAALERKALPVRVLEVDLRSILLEVHHLFQPQALEWGISLILDADTPAVAAADPDHVRRILTNLVSNALKFTPPQGIVSMRLSALDGQARISVLDNGPGIPPDQQNRLFQKFSQIPSTRPTARGGKGTGLGLSLAKCLAELQGGTLEIQSAAGQGACFTLTLPRERRTS